MRRAENGQGGMRITRADRSVLSDWWFTVDRLMFFGLLLLMGAGLVLSLAASPPVAAKYHLEHFYFVRRHAAMLLPALAIMFAASTLTPKQIRRASLVIFIVGIALMVLTMLVGPEIKGARRWLQIGMVSLQPSEFVKPAFVVLVAWLFNEAQKRRDVPGIQLAIALYAIFALLLILQPDFGQTLLVTLIWGGLFFMAGINLFWIGVLGVAGLAGTAASYTLVPHVASRIDRFLYPASGDTYQADRALDSFLHGGWLGRGPGEGTVKDVLPDSHTDFIFAVVAEEYGLIACLILLALFAFIVLRGLSKAAQEPDGFIRHATAGLIMLFGLQALINMAVNVGLLPAKGMTLPFISYGGSSLLAMALTMGFALGLTRRRPTAGRLERSTSESGTEGTGASARGSPGGSAGTSAGTSAKEHAA
jgi:cell division protein FtsW